MIKRRILPAARKSIIPRWKIKRAIKRVRNTLIERLYIRYVLQPEVCARFAQQRPRDFEIVLIPPEVMQAQLQARFNVKH